MYVFIDLSVYVYSFSNKKHQWTVQRPQCGWHTSNCFLQIPVNCVICWPNKKKKKKRKHLSPALVAINWYHNNVLIYGRVNGLPPNSISVQSSNLWKTRIKILYCPITAYKLLTKYGILWLSNSYKCYQRALLMQMLETVDIQYSIVLVSILIFRKTPCIRT